MKNKERENVMNFTFGKAVRTASLTDKGNLVHSLATTMNYDEEIYRKKERIHTLYQEAADILNPRTHLNLCSPRCISGYSKCAGGTKIL